jgi:hypothetical protein
MQHLVGLEDSRWRSTSEVLPVILNTDHLINGHMLFAGMSGTGKSWQIKALLATAAKQGITCDVFDVHEELDDIPGAKAVRFSEATKTGYNPLDLSTNEHSGGVRRQISWLIDTINRSSRELGPRQEAALRNLLSDVYYLRGCYAETPSSWSKKTITEDQYAAMIRARDYNGLKAYYPTLRDVISYAERQLKIMTTGADSRVINALERVESTAAKMNGLMKRFGKACSDEEITKLETQLGNEKGKAIDAYVEFIQGIESGKEFQTYSKYTSKDTLQSLIERLQGLLDCGIMQSNPPQWGDAKLRVYQINSLSDSERRLLFYTRAEAVLRECMDLGKTDTVRRILLVDEGHIYYSEDPDNPLNRIAKEGRKFGLSLVIGSQSPTHFSEDFLTNCGTVFLLGIHGQYWDMACKKLGMERALLQATRPREVLTVKMQRLGEPTARFVAVNVQQQVVEQGVEYLRSRRKAA